MLAFPNLFAGKRKEVLSMHITLFITLEDLYYTIIIIHTIMLIVDMIIKGRKK